MNVILNLLRTITLGAALTAALGTAQAGTISTLPSTGNIGFFGAPSSGSTPTYGETFVATAALGLYLSDFTFYFQNNSAGTLAYQAQVYRWSGSGVIGSALFSTNATIGPTGTSYVPITTQVNDLALLDQTSYIALFTTVNTGGSVGGLRAQNSLDSSYPSGTFEYNNSATAAGLSGNWNNVGNFGDLTFTMNFDAAPSAVPEPDSLALAGLALLAAAVARRRKS